MEQKEWPQLLEGFHVSSQTLVQVYSQILWKIKQMEFQVLSQEVITKRLCKHPHFKYSNSPFQCRYYFLEQFVFVFFSLHSGFLSIFSLQQAEEGGPPTSMVDRPLARLLEQSVCSPNVYSPKTNALLLLPFFLAKLGKQL